MSKTDLPDDFRPLYERIYAVVQQIPRGKVATYGQIAGIVGDCTARMVGYAMAATPAGSNVPWQRVINAQGKVSPRAQTWETEEQRQRLREEGVEFDAQDKVDFAVVRWPGPDLEWLLENGFTPPEERGWTAEDDLQPRLI